MTLLQNHGKKRDFVTIFSENYVNNGNLKDKRSGMSDGILHCYMRFSHPSKLLKKQRVQLLWKFYR
jgi:hypothetical protein